MSTIDAKTGQILDTPTNTGGADPYAIFSRNLTTMLTNAQKVSSQGNANLEGQIGGLQRGQSLLGNSSGPLAFLYNQETPSQSTASQSKMSDVFKPGITSIQGQEQLANENMTNIQNTVKTATDMYTATQNAGIGSHDIGQVPGSLSQYSYDSRTGTYTNLSTGSTSSTAPTADPTQFGNTTFQGIDLSGNATGTQAYASEGVNPQDPNYNAKAGAITAKKWQTVYDGMQSYAKTYYQTNSTDQPQYSPVTGDGTVVGDWIFKGGTWVNQPSTTTQASALDAYIKAHSKGSPVSGLMIMNAANQYNMDPWAAAAGMANESDFGTSGVAVNTMNPFNNGNTDNGSTKTYQSWQAGVNAGVANLASRTPGNTNTQTPSVGPITKTPAPSNAIDLLAWQVLNNLKSPSDAKAVASDVPSGNIALNNSLVKQSQSAGFLYDEGKTQAQFDARKGSIGSQTTTVNDLSAARQSVASQANNLISTLTGVNGDLSNLNPNQLNIVNKGLQLIAGQTSNTKYKTLQNLMFDIASTYSGILSPGGNTDTTRASAQALVDSLAKGSSIAEILANLDKQAQEKIGGYQTNIQNVTSGANPNPLTSFINSSVPIGMTLNGKHYTYNGSGDTSILSNWTQK